MMNSNGRITAWPSGFPTVLVRILSGSGRVLG
jgi:hypothetical protein